MSIEIKDKIVTEHNLKVKNGDVAEHTMTKHLTEIVITPEHAERTESEEFVKTKKTLKKDDHYHCWICNSEEHLQVHHFGCEWSLEADCDFDKLKDLLMLFDFYGYSHSMKDIPLTSVDDIRNMLVLCQRHHTHPENGIHEITFPVWISQKWAKDTTHEAVPQDV